MVCFFNRECECSRRGCDKCGWNPVVKAKRLGLPEWSVRDIPDPCVSCERADFCSNHFCNGRRIYSKALWSRVHAKFQQLRQQEIADGTRRIFFCYEHPDIVRERIANGERIFKTEA